MNVISMSLENILADAEKSIRKIVPETISITKIDFEGPIIVIYTKNMDEFAGHIAPRRAIKPARAR